MGDETPKLSTELMREVRRDYVALLKLLNELFDQLNDELTAEEEAELKQILASLTFNMDCLGRWIRKHKKEERPDDIKWREENEN